MSHKESQESPQIAVFAQPDANFAQAQNLAEKLQLPYLQQFSDDYPFLLELSAEHLALRDTQSRDHAVFVDFLGGAVGHRYRSGIGRKEPIARAVGVKAQKLPSVLDATAGLGRDAFVLASLGCQMQLLERSPIIAALLADGIARASADPDVGAWLAPRLQLRHCDSLAWMRAHPAQVDTVYLDPMYPHRRKSALVKKEMRFLRAVVGDDVDAQDLLDAALSCARDRVVVKRPKGAEVLAERPPNAQIQGKTTRFDLYLKPKSLYGI